MTELMLFHEIYISEKIQDIADITRNHKLFWLLSLDIPKMELPYFAFLI